MPTIANAIADPEPDTNFDPQSDAKPDTNAVTEPQSDAKPYTNAVTEPQSDAKPNTHAIPDSKSNSHRYASWPTGTHGDSDPVACGESC